MALIRDIGVHSYAELHVWFAQYCAEFWHTMMQRLGIRFRQNYDEIVDLSRREKIRRAIAQLPEINIRLNRK
ncbi:hypothetical protein [Leptothermofonsia sp. ETS-13]|uniref:hypothetical protein n=1 Tax=Leptothermofonsia sp. ETS-13 TaxID=3035696 RepID=UPI003BA04549